MYAPPAADGPNRQTDLRHRARQVHLVVEDAPGVAPPGKHVELIGDARARRVDQVDQRHGQPPRRLLDAHDLLDGARAPRARLYRRVVGHHRHRATVNLAQPRHHAVGRQLGRRVVGEQPVLDKIVDVVEEQLEPLAHEQLALLRVFFVVLLGAALRDLLDERRQIFRDMWHAPVVSAGKHSVKAGVERGHGAPRPCSSWIWRRFRSRTRTGPAADDLAVYQQALGDFTRSDRAVTEATVSERCRAAGLNSSQVARDTLANYVDRNRVAPKLSTQLRSRLFFNVMNRRAERRRCTSPPSGGAATTTRPGSSSTPATSAQRPTTACSTAEWASFFPTAVGNPAAPVPLMLCWRCFLTCRWRRCNSVSQRGRSRRLRAGAGRLVENSTTRKAFGGGVAGPMTSSSGLDGVLPSRIDLRDDSAEFWTTWRLYVTHNLVPSLPPPRAQASRVIASTSRLSWKQDRAAVES